MASTTGPLAGRRAPLSDRVAWAVITAAAVAVGLFSITPYLTYDADASHIPLDPAHPLHFLWVTLHAFPGVLALLVGPVEFVKAVRRRHPAAHRVLGRVYLLSVLFAASWPSPPPSPPPPGSPPRPRSCC